MDSTGNPPLASKIVNCKYDLQFIGGFDALEPNGYMERTYTNIPNHEFMNIVFEFWRLEDWDNDDIVEL